MAMKDQLALEQPPQPAFDWLFVAVLSITAGAVDVIGFLALGGLFTAHITGNILGDRPKAAIDDQVKSGHSEKA
jgi:hypothetical protein